MIELRPPQTALLKRLVDREAVGRSGDMETLGKIDADLLEEAHDLFVFHEFSHRLDIQLFLKFISLLH